LTLANLDDDASFLDDLELPGQDARDQRMQYYPIMAVSKFMHFSSQKLFPIYDTSVVSNEVLGSAFATE